MSAASKCLVPDLPSADDVLPYLRRIDRMRWYSNFGPLVCEFEEGLQRLLSEKDDRPQAGRIHVATLVSGHCALYVGLRLAGIGRGKTVLLPAVTFPSCPLAVLHSGAAVVLADIDPIAWTLTPQIARAAAERTQIDAVMPVAIYGVPLPTSEWDEFSFDTGIPVLIDAAAAIDAQFPPGRGLVAYSLHATKPLGIGEGGVLAGRDPDIIARARQYTNFGMINRVTLTDGTNAKMSEYHAAVGLAQLNRWTAAKKKRNMLLQVYVRHLEPLLGYASLQPSIQTAVASHLMLLLKQPIAEAVLALGREAGIGFHRPYLPPLYRHPHFEQLPLVDSHGVELPPEADVDKKWAQMPNCERLRECLVGLPFHPFMDETDVNYVVNTLRIQLFRLFGNS